MSAKVKMLWPWAAWRFVIMACVGAGGVSSLEGADRRATSVPNSCTPAFLGLGVPGGASPSFARDVSADGTTVTGFYGSEAFRFSGTLELLGILPGGYFSNGTGVSRDGSVVVGHSNDPVFVHAVMWQDGELTKLGFLPGGSYSVANDISDNARVVVGVAHNGTTLEAFRWDARAGMVGLGTLDGRNSEAWAVNRDGSVIVGTIYDTSTTEAFLWQRGAGMSALGFLDGFHSSKASGVSANGRVVFGSVYDGSNSYPARWTRQDGWERLGSAPGGVGAASSDGSVVVGSYIDEVPQSNALIWDEVNGVRSIQEVLTAAGMSLTGWRLRAASGISNDGKVVAGYGINPFGKEEAWMACMP